MKLYSYVITRDYGFAPNPFGQYCSLATCKPLIRKSASIGDWIMGTGSASKEYNMGNRLIYVMKVDESMSFDMYWNNPRFQYKKPVMNGSKKQKYGDNIYFFDQSKGKYVQIDSHHSHGDGSTNEKNYYRDLRGEKVLVSSHFWYFGEEAPQIPEELVKKMIRAGIGYKKVSDTDVIEHFILWLSNRYERGLIGLPLLFGKNFERYRGK